MFVRIDSQCPKSHSLAYILPYNFEIVLGKCEISEFCVFFHIMCYIYFIQCYGSGMFIPVPGSDFSPIPDPRYNTKKRAGKK